MGKPRPLKTTRRPLTPEEKYGHVWAAVFFALVFALAIGLSLRSCS